jgi:hypothetical protein
VIAAFFNYRAIFLEKNVKDDYNLWQFVYAVLILIHFSCSGSNLHRKKVRSGAHFPERRNVGHAVPIDRLSLFFRYVKLLVVTEFLFALPPVC